MEMIRHRSPGRAAEVAAACDTWLHVDGAYGGAALAAPSVRERFAGIERAERNCTLEVLACLAEALENGLVDGLGGVPEALDMAAEMAGIRTYRIKTLPKYKSGLERLMDDLGGNQMGSEGWIEAELGTEWLQTFTQLKTILSQEGIHARLPFTLNLK